MGIKSFVTASLIVFIIAVAVIFGVWIFLKDPVSEPALESANTETENNQNQIKTFTMADLAMHNSEEDCWVAIGDKVYNLTSVISGHPGGAEAIINQCGKDGTSAFQERGGKGPHPQKAQDNLNNYYEGELSR